MGMAASQARLLTLTARQHDVEYQAQAIQNAKIQLATQQDRVYEEYQAALDATTLTLTSINTESGVKATVAATFNNLFSSRRLTPATQSEYALFDRNGRVVVEDDIYQNYYAFVDEASSFPKTPQAFAMYMLFGNNVDSTAIIESEWQSFYDGENYYNDEQMDRLTELRDHILTMFGLDPYNEDRTGDGDGTWYDIYNVPSGLAQDPDFDWDTYDKYIKEYLNILYSSKGANHIYRNLEARSQGNGVNESDLPESVQVDMSQFNYYMHIFQVIESCGGCVSIDDFNGFNGNASNDSEWLTNMISSGLMTISTLKVDNKTGDISFDGTSPSSDTNISYTNVSTIDSTAVKKAEAKYEHALKQINQKDKKFDLDLSKLDSERNALKTEYDSVKKVIEDNIDRSFGIFS